MTGKSVTNRLLAPPFISLFFPPFAPDCVWFHLARYLVDHPTQLPTWATVAVLIVQTVGYLAFRGSNLQKDRFRRDPNSPQVKHVKYINTKRGTKLMVSGKCKHSHTRMSLSE